MGLHITQRTQEAVQPKPYLLQRGSQQQRWDLLPLGWWHLSSLDAPTVAVVWTWWVARCVNIVLPAADLLSIFLTVWLLYVADRLLDARPLMHGRSAAGLEDRHLFHHAHRNVFLTISLCVVGPLAWLLHQLHEGELRLYVLLTCCLGAWLLVVHARPLATTGRSHELPKELAVGIFFPAATFIPSIARMPYLRLPLLPFASLFALVCALNCFLLFAWEHPVRPVSGHCTTRWASRHPLLLGIGILSVCISGALASFVFQRTLSVHFLELATPLVLSCVGLMLLHLSRRHFQQTTLRATADLALLTPIPVYLVSQLCHFHG